MELDEFLTSNQLGAEAVELLTGSWSERITLAKNDYLLKKGQKENYLYFIASGCVALMVETEHENQVLGFGYESSIISAFISFSTTRPSELSLFALRGTEVLRISKKDLFELRHKCSEIDRWYSVLLEQMLIGHLNRQVELITLPAKERYHSFLKRSGHLVNSIPLKFISSYLHMAPETLSRMRKVIS
jgi:CRP-like cAMP-binding protein